MHRRNYTTLQQPAAGAEIVDIPNYGDSHKLLSLRAQFVTSAVVANRFPHLQLADRNGNVYWEVVAGTAQAAGTTVTYSWVSGSGAMNQGTTLVDNLVSMPLPEFWVPEQFCWKTKTTAIDVGDQWQNITVQFIAGNEWEHLQYLEEIAHLVGS